MKKMNTAASADTSTNHAGIGTIILVLVALIGAIVDGVVINNGDKNPANNLLPAAVPGH